MDKYLLIKRIGKYNTTEYYTNILDEYWMNKIKEDKLELYMYDYDIHKYIEKEVK